LQAARSGAAHVPSPLDSADAHRAAATRRRTSQPPPPRPEKSSWRPCEPRLPKVRAEFDVDRHLAQFGTRVTPAMAKLAKPLLVELLAERAPARGPHLRGFPRAPESEVRSMEETVLEAAEGDHPTAGPGSTDLIAHPSWLPQRQRRNDKGRGYSLRVLTKMPYAPDGVFEKKIKTFLSLQHLQYLLSSDRNNKRGI